MPGLLTRSHVPGILIMSFFFGSNLVVSRFVLGQLHPLVLVSLRLTIAAVVALIWARVQLGRLPRGRRLWLHGSVVGVLATGVPMVCFITALLYQSSGVTALCIALTPITAMLYAHVRLKDDRMTVRKVTGAVVSFAGVGLLLATGETGLGEPHWEGFVLVLVGVACGGFGIVHVRKYLADEHALDITAIRLLTAAALTLPLAIIADGFDLSRVEWTGLLSVVYGSAGTFVGFLLYSYVTARFGATRATQSEYIVPIVATAGGAIFLSEKVSVIVALGMVVIITGIVFATWSPRAGRRTPTSGREAPPR